MTPLSESDGQITGRDWGGTTTGTGGGGGRTVTSALTARFSRVMDLLSGLEQQIRSHRPPQLKDRITWSSGRNRAALALTFTM